jgi:hypothetical protein
MSEPAAAAAFSAHAREYMALRRRLVPGFEAFYGSVTDVLGMLEPAPAWILDLGAGTGLLSAVHHLEDADKRALLAPPGGAGLMRAFSEASSEGPLPGEASRATLSGPRQPKG